MNVYADHAATAPVTEAVRAAIAPYLDAAFGNPSSQHKRGREAARAIFAARRDCAAVLGCDANEVIFTSGGTESDNFAIKGTAFAHNMRGHIVTTAIEHHAVLHSLAFLERNGMEVTYVKPDTRGIVSPDNMARAMREDTVLCVCMLANNEIGTVQPIRTIAAYAHEKHIPVFCDAVQGMGQLPVRVDDLGVDLLSLSGHKLGGIRGAGLLYVRGGTPLVPLIDGGGQELGLRSGTENTAAIVGLAQAMRDMAGACDETAAYLEMLSAILWKRLAAIPGCVVNGTTERGLRLPGNVNVSFPGMDAESLVLQLDRCGIAASAGSACTAGETRPSHVLTAIGCDAARATSSLRLTLGRENTPREMEYIADCIREITLLI